jgi:hypothetical protein
MIVRTEVALKDNSDESEVLTRDDLDQLRCSTPNCGHDHTILYLRPRCHIDGGVEAFYDKRDGTLTLSCNVCGERLATLQIAQRTTGKSH